MEQRGGHVVIRADVHFFHLGELECCFPESVARAPSSPGA